MKIKICGIREKEDLAAIAAMHPDYMGFIFYPKSPRYMAEVLEPADLAVIRGPVCRTGVFVNESAESVAALAAAYDLGAVQLHGEAPPGYLRKLRRALGKDVVIIRAFGIDEHFDWDALNDYQDCCDMFLFDTKSSNYGGSGRQFDRGLLAGYKLDVPVMLAGGLGVEDVAELRGLDIAVADLNSRLETAPGKKDIDLVRRAIEAARSQENRR